MAIEKARGCGFRTQYSLYIKGNGVATDCDRLPFKIEACDHCGELPTFNRALRKINPLKIFGAHNKEDENGLEELCSDNLHCDICYPLGENHHGLMWIGKQFYPTIQDFISEVNKMGLSRKIPYVPKWLVNNKSIIYLARDGIIDEDIGFIPKKGKQKKADGIFMAVTVTGLEYVIPEKEKKNKELLKQLKSQGIKPIFVPNDDPDHMNKRKPKNLPIKIQQQDEEINSGLSEKQIKNIGELI